MGEKRKKNRNKHILVGERGGADFLSSLVWIVYDLYQRGAVLSLF